MTELCTTRGKDSWISWYAALRFQQVIKTFRTRPYFALGLDCTTERIQSLVNIAKPALKTHHIQHFRLLLTPNNQYLRHLDIVHKSWHSSAVEDVGV